MEQTEYKKLAEIDLEYWWFKAKRKYIESFLPHTVRTSYSFKILDIGCGTGGITLFLKNFGTVQAVEQNSFAASTAKQRGIDVLQADANELPFASETFSLVTCFDVLYHKKISIEKVLLEVNRVLMPHGRILITDSALPSLWSHHDMVMHARQRFTLKELTSILESHGFTVVHKTYIYFFLLPLIYISRKIFMQGTSKDSVIPQMPVVLENIFLLLCRAEAALIKYTSLPIGSSLFVLAKKK